MTADEILELFCHPSFLSLRSISVGWVIAYDCPDKVKFLKNGTLDMLLAEYANIIDQIDSTKGE